MREIKSYVQLIVADFDALDRFLDANDDTAGCTRAAAASTSAARCLFVLTAESNFCGRKYNLNIVKKIKRGRKRVISALQSL